MDDIPGLPITDHAMQDELYIEWDEPVIGGERVVDDTLAIDEFDDSFLHAMLDEVQTDSMLEELGELVEVDPLIDYFDDTPADQEPGDADFHVFWPNGESDPVLHEPAVDVTASDATMLDDAAFDDTSMDAQGVTVDDFGAKNFAEEIIAAAEEAAETTADEVAVLDVGDDGGREFEMVRRFEQLTQANAEVDGVSGVPAADEVVSDVPDDVADAVRQVVATLEFAPTLPDGHQSAHASPSFASFAPPSLDTSAEALYARAVAAHTAAATGLGTSASSEATTVADDASPLDAGPLDVGPVGQFNWGANVSHDELNERASALRRLIGSLRRKDR